MARPREFDEAEVVQRARAAMWARGIDSSSISDLCQATDLSVGSLYKAFGSKAGLVRVTIDTYLTEQGHHIVELFASLPPAEALQTYVDLVVESASSDASTRGCYSVTAAIELGSIDEWVRARLERQGREVRSALAVGLAGATRARGGNPVAPDEGAKLLYTVVSGIQVAARTGISADEARQQLDLTLRLILGAE